MFLIAIIMFTSVNAVQPEDYVKINSPEYEISDIKVYYLLNYCHLSQIKRKYNSTHIENRFYKEANCINLDHIEYMNVTYIFNMQNEIETKAYYIWSYYYGNDCNDIDILLPVYSYELYTNEHCNKNQKNNSWYIDISKERFYLCVGAIDHSTSTICEENYKSGNDWCETKYIEQCYQDMPGYYSTRVTINKEKFNAATNSTEALKFLVVLIFLFILI